MSNAYTSAGTKIFIGADEPATFDKAGFEAVVWTEIGEVTDLGEFGKEYNIVNHNPLGTRQTIKRKGSYDNGAISLNLARDISDAGQVALLAALDSDDSYSIKVVLADSATTHLYTTAQVSSFTYNVGGVDSITSGTVALQIDNEILSEAAPA